MATRTITALFDTYESAADAVRKLEAQGVSHGDISIVSNDSGHSRYYDTAGTGDGDHASGTGTGASLGTLLGGGAGLLAGLGMLAIPGLGPVVAAGWLASTLVGAGVGAAAGGVVGSLTDAGVSHEDAHLYAEGIRRGGTLVTVRASDTMVDRVTDVLDVDGTVDLDQRESSWRSEGWNGEYAGSPGSTSSAGTLGSSTGAIPASTSSTAYSDTSSPRGTAMGGVANAVSRAAETIKDDARKVGDKLTGDSDRAFGSGAGLGTGSAMPVTDYGSTPRQGEGERLLGRNRVRVYPEAL